MSRFQIILTAVFGMLILIGVAIFAGIGPGGTRGGGVVNLTIWGTLDRDALGGVFEGLNEAYRDIADISYAQHSSVTLEQDLIEALARGQGPDLLIMPHDLLVRQSDKLAAIPYKQISQRSFLDTYLDGADVFLAANGIMALPLLVDPMVLYWNKDLFSAAGLPKPPTYWDEALTLPAKLTVRDAKGNIRQSTIALGGYRNIANAKEILSTLFFQVGDPVAKVQYLETGGISSNIVLGSAVGQNASQAESALRFYAEFGNPSKAAYSWNNALINSRDLFTAGNLAMYLAPASELAVLKNANPHLNFDVAPIPQIRPTSQTKGTKQVFARMYGVGVLRASANIERATLLAQTMASDAVARILVQGFNVPSARRDLALSSDTNAYLESFNIAALTGRTWPDPSPADSNAIFRAMVESVLVGGTTEQEAISIAREALERLAPQTE